MEEATLKLGYIDDPSFNITPKLDASKFKRKSNDPMWAGRGLGKTTTAVDAFVEMFSSLLYKEGMEVPTTEVERWLDAYYQLRYEAEKEAYMVQFMANGCKTKGMLEPIIPNVNKDKATAKEDNKWLDPILFLALMAIFSGGRCSFGDEIKDPDEKKEEKKPGELRESLKNLLSKQDYDKLTPLGKAFADVIADKFEPEAPACKSGVFNGPKEDNK